jgi:hypothetical protein
MAEKGGTRPDETRAQWAVTGTKTEFSGGRKTSGWLFQDIPPFDGENWRFSFYNELYRYLFGSLTRSFFLSLEDAIVDATVDYGDVFWVLKENDDLPFDILESTTVYSSGGDNTFLACDGLRLFFPDTVTPGKVVALDSEDYTDELWFNADPVLLEIVSAIECDGAYVVLGYNSGAGATKGALLRADTGARTGFFVDALVTTPVNGVCLSPLHAWFCLGTSLVRRTIPGLTAPLLLTIVNQTKRCAADHDQVYFTSEGTTDVHCYLHDGTPVWNTGLVTGGAGPTDGGYIVADGEFVFVADFSGTWYFQPSLPLMGIPVNIWCLDRLTGSALNHSSSV